MNLPRHWNTIIAWSGLDVQKELYYRPHCSSSDMAQLTLSEGFFFGLIFETFFYSIFLVVLGSSLYLQWERVHDHSSTVTKPVLVFSLVLGVLISVVSSTFSSFSFFPSSSLAITAGS